MAAQGSSPLAGDKLKKALQEFSELQEKYPEKSRQELLHQIELKFDLSPFECDFLNKNFSD